MGKVYLVGAGPGDPELLTRKAERILSSAGVALHDSLVSAEILSLIPSGAHVIDVGKRAGRKLLTQDEINALLVFHAQAYPVVVRLKGGDPLFFGRAGEELEALRLAGVEHEVVPGITAAFGAAAAAGISLTDRRTASQVLFTTFSRSTPDSISQWSDVTSATTLVLYMPGPDYAEVARRLLDSGLPANTPCVIVSNATRAQQELRWTDVARLQVEATLPAPSLLIVGHVAARTVREIGAAYWSGERVAPELAGVGVS